MFKQFWGWKSLVALVTILIVAGTLFYVNILTHRLEQEERQKMTTWVEANKEILQAPADANLNLAIDIVANNTSIPIIQTDAQGRIVSTNNIDSSKIRRDPDYLKEQLALFRSQHPPLLQRYNPSDSSQVNYIYYGDSFVLRLLRYYPYIQLSILAFLIVIILIALSVTNKATQNQVWIGLAKETAHATEEIGQKIAAIRSDANEEVTAITEINELIHKISDIQTTIAGAVEQQAATTGEISRSASQAAEGSSEIARNLAGVARAADGTLGGAGEARTAAESLTQMASELQKLVDHFRTDDGSTEPQHKPHTTFAKVAVGSQSGAEFRAGSIRQSSRLPRQSVPRQN